jgi:hypothetical protein
MDQIAPVSSQRPWMTGIGENVSLFLDPLGAPVSTD